MPRWACVLALLSTGVGGAAHASGEETTVFGYVERGRTHVFVWSAQSLEGATLTIQPTGSSAAERANLRLFLFDSDRFGEATGLPVKVGLYDATIQLGSGAVEHVRFVAYGGAECLGVDALGASDLTAAQASAGPKWRQEPRIENLEVAEFGGAVTRVTTGPVPRGTLLAVTLRDPSDRPLWFGVGKPLEGAPTQVCPQTVTDWPDHVVAEVTLIDLAGRTSEARRIELAVLKPPADEMFSTLQKILLFVVAPFGMGFVVGGALQRRCHP